SFLFPIAAHGQAHYHVPFFFVLHIVSLFPAQQLFSVLQRLRPSSLHLLFSVPLPVLWPGLFQIGLVWRPPVFWRPPNPVCSSPALVSAFSWRFQPLLFLILSVFSGLVLPTVAIPAHSIHHALAPNPLEPSDLYNHTLGWGPY